jgi:predicted TIM-barrel fold metal-dependent hydrolase
LGLLGIGFHNAQQGVPIDSPLMLKLIEKIADAGMTPFIHALGNPLESIWQVDGLAARFPETPMIILDVFHEITQIRALPEIAQRRRNLYFDLSLMLSFELMGQPAVEAVGAERFMFGTNFYSWPAMREPIGRPLEQILESTLSDNDKAAILGENAIKVLGLSGA